MEMIGHRTINRTEEVFAYYGMKCQLSKSGMESRCKPATRPGFKCVCPENDRVTLIMTSLQTGQIAFVIKGHGLRIPREADIVKH